MIDRQKRNERGRPVSIGTQLKNAHRLQRSVTENPGTPSLKAFARDLGWRKVGGEWTEAKR